MVKFLDRFHFSFSLLLRFHHFLSTSFSIQFISFSIKLKCVLVETIKLNKWHWLFCSSSLPVSQLFNFYTINNKQIFYFSFFSLFVDFIYFQCLTSSCLCIAVLCLCVYPLLFNTCSSTFALYHLLSSYSPLLSTLNILQSLFSSLISFSIFMLARKRERECNEMLEFSHHFSSPLHRSNTIVFHFMIEFFTVFPPIRCFFNLLIFGIISSFPTALKRRRFLLAFDQIIFAANLIIISSFITFVSVFSNQFLSIICFCLFFC